MNGNQILEIKAFGEGVSSLRGEAPCLHIESLSIESKKVYAIIGPSGSGKSVFTSLLMRYPSFCNFREMRNRDKVVCEGGWPVVLYLPQHCPEGRGYEMTTEEYCREIGYAMLVSCNIIPDENCSFELDGELEDLQGKKIRDLSGGQRRRVELDMRLKVVDYLEKRRGDDSRSVLLVLDEPTTGFDWCLQKKFLDKVGRAGHEDDRKIKFAILVVTHDLNRLEMNDKSEGELKNIFDEVICVMKESVKEDERRPKNGECCRILSPVPIEDLARVVKDERPGGYSGGAWEWLVQSLEDSEFGKVDDLLKKCKNGKDDSDA